MLVLFLALSAHAADFTAKLDKKPFIVKTALAMPDPERPWVWAALVSDEAFTCEQITSGEANRNVSSKTTNVDGKVATTTEVTGPTTDTRLVVMFAESTPGTAASLVFGSGRGGKDLPLDTAIVKIAAGNTLDFNLKGKHFSATGSLPLTFCAPLGERPTIAWAGPVVDVTIAQLSMFEDHPEQQLPVKFALPEGWTYAAPDRSKYQFSQRWTAPDQMTLLELSLEDPTDDFAKYTAEWATMQVEALKGSDFKVLRNEAIGTGAYVLDYGTPDRRALVVIRSEPGWAHLVRCTVNADGFAAEAVFPAAAQACAAMTAP